MIATILNILSRFRRNIFAAVVAICIAEIMRNVFLFAFSSR